MRGRKLALPLMPSSFLEFSELDMAVKEEVEFVKAHPLILKETEVTIWQGSLSTYRTVQGLIWLIHMGRFVVYFELVLNYQMDAFLE